MRRLTRLLTPGTAMLLFAVRLCQAASTPENIVQRSGARRKSRR